MKLNVTIVWAMLILLLVFPVTAEDWSQYKTQDISFNYPSDWRADETNKQISLQPISAGEGILIWYVLEEQEYFTQRLSEDEKNELIDLFTKKVLPAYDANRDRYQTTEISGLQAIEIYATSPATSEFLEQKYKFVIVWDASRLHLLAYSAPTVDYYKYESIFDQVVASFQVLEPRKITFAQAPSIRTFAEEKIISKPARERLTKQAIWIFGVVILMLLLIWTSRALTGKRQKIRIPKSLQFRVDIGLIVALLIFISIYFLLYNLGGYILLAFGVLPLLFIQFIEKSKYGQPITEKEHPKLIKTVSEVADKLGMRMPDEIVVTPSGEIAVHGMFKKKLIIGLAGLRSLSIPEFKAILAHEFGHFYGKDTVIGGILYRIGHSLNRTSEFGEKWYNAMPIYHLAAIGFVIQLFFKIYEFIYNLAVLAYSRQVEYRADYIASQIAGKGNFSNGLLNYSTFTTYFDKIAYDYMHQLLQKGQMFQNVYKYLYDTYKKEKISVLKKKVLEMDKGSFWASHPPLRKRLKAVGEAPVEKSQASAISLFKDIDKLEKEMTVHLTELYYRHIKQTEYQMLYEEAVAREGRCKYCDKKFDYLDKLLKHEAQHEKKN